MAPPTSGAAALRARAIALLGPLGVVFGDIGTSPLYALREASADVPRGVATALGLASTAFWALLLVISVKYVTFILRADHHGDGGIFALLGLLHEKEGNGARRKLSLLALAVIAGAALLYGEGVITPAISVLSAWEGLRLVHPAADALVVPLTLLTLALLFAFQQRGTERIGRTFGVVMAVWFVALAALGLPWIVRHPEVLRALNPLVALRFLAGLDLREYVRVVGAITLCVTGVEALYADMGHFSRRRIRTAWLVIVFPALALNYLGQAARLMEPATIPDGNLFYALVPSSLIIPLVALATLATIIASQALISGAFSLTNQAMQLGLFPRMAVVHTSGDVPGQIYMPGINRILAVGAIGLVLMFQTSSALAGAYGLAVAGTMTVTTLAFTTVAVRVLGWQLPAALALGAAFLAVDAQFLAANALKFTHGGYVPVLVALALVAVMTTWHWGRQQLSGIGDRFSTKSMRWLADLKARVDAAGGHLRDRRGTLCTVNRAVVFLCSTPVEADAPIPLVVRLFLKSYGVIPRRMLLLHVGHVSAPVNPVGTDQQRYERVIHGPGIRSITARYGYMEQPNVGSILNQLLREGLEDFPAGKWVIEVGEQDITIASGLPLLVRLRALLFRRLLTTATPAYAYYGLGVVRDLPLTISKTIVPVLFARDGAHLVLPSADLAEPEAVSIT